MTDAGRVELSRRELTILISALLNSDEFIAEDYETVMGNSRSEAWTLMEKLIIERDQTSSR